MHGQNHSVASCLQKKMQKTYTHKHTHNESRQTNNYNNRKKIIQKKKKANQINKKRSSKHESIKHINEQRRSLVQLSRKRKRTNHFHNV